MTARTIPARRGRRLLLAGSGLIAIVAAGAAHAQAAFQGNATVTAGSVAYSSPNANTDVFTVRTPSAILDWTPKDTAIGGGPIAFLPNGKTGIFQSSSSNSFTVLNRINPADATRPIAFDGHVISQFVDAASGATSRAGNIWFYTPGGIIIGATGVFDVGSLILTTNAIDTTNGVPAPGGTISFRGAAGSTSTITVQPGARINATAPGSYVALVAPRIAQGGTVNVNGSVGYVAAEAADITINAGLFSIANTIGSEVAEGGETTLTHTGTTTGPEATSADQQHNIYMVAIPKNDAVTMLVSGDVGYEGATTAGVIGGQVILGAGYAFGVGQGNNGPVFNPVAAGGGQASTIHLTDATLTSIAYAYSNGDFVGDTALGDISILKGLNADANRSVTLHVDDGHSIDDPGALGLGVLTGADGNRSGIPITIGVDAGGTLSASYLAVFNSTYSSGGATTGGTTTMTINGTATFGLLQMYSDNSPSARPESTAGGTARIIVDGGTLTGGTTLLSATGNSGGDAEVLVTNGGRASFTSLEIGADGASDPSAQFSGLGGTATLTASGGGSVSVSGALDVHAKGTAGSGSSDGAPPPVSGGIASIVADGGTVTIAGDVTLDASGTGSPGSQGGAGTGGTAQIVADTGGAVSVAGFTTIAANGSGGDSSDAVAGGTGTGGTATLSAGSADGDGQISLAGLAMFANGRGGSGAPDPATNGFGQGGTATIETANGGGFSASGPGLVQASGFGGDGGGDATGGTVRLAIGGANGGDRLGDFTLSADGRAAANADDSGAPNVGTGGTVIVQTLGADVTIGSLTAGAGGFVGSPYANDTGHVQFLLGDYGPLAITNDLTVRAVGAVTIDATGSGGLAIGGTALTDDVGSIQLTHSDATSDTIRAGEVNFTAIDDITIAQTNRAAGVASIATTGDGDLLLTAGGNITASGALVSAGGDVEAHAQGLVSLASVSAGDSFTATAHDTLSVQSATSGTAGGDIDGNIGLTATHGITIGSATAFGSIGVLAPAGAISATSLVAGVGGPAYSSIVVLGQGAITLGTVSAPYLLYVGGPAAIAGLDSDATPAQVLAALTAAGPVANGADISITTATAGQAILTAGSALALGSLTTATNALLGATGNLTASHLVAAAGVTATSSGGEVDLEGLVAPAGVTARGTSLILRGTGDLHVLSATASAGSATIFGATSLIVDALSATGGISGGSNGSAHFGDLTTGGGIQLSGGAGLVTGNLHANNSITAGSLSGAVMIGDAESVGGAVRVTALGDIAIGNVRAAGSIYLTGGGAITSGNLTAGTGPLLPGESNGGGGTDSAPGGIATGFDQFSIAACDDCSTPEILLPFAVNFFGSGYADTYVSNNGYITFQSGQPDYTPTGLGANYSGQPIIAAFFADVDTRGLGSALATYGTGTYAGRQAFAATWNGVGYFPAAADKLNNFQIILTNRADTGTGNFDIYFNYTNISWETGSASGGSNGFGGTSAAVGYNAGTGNQPGTFFELPGSRIPGSLLNGGPAALIANSNDGTPGQFLFTVRNGQVMGGGATEPPTIHVTNIAAGNSADVTLGNLSADAVEVHGAGHVEVGSVAVADHGSGIAAPGNPLATVLDSADGLIAGDISGAGFVAVGASQGDISTGTITSSSSVAVLASGTVSLGAVTTGTGAGDSLFISNPSVLASDPALSGFAFNTILSGTNFDPATLATQTPVRTGGPITVTGPIATGNLLAASGGTATFAGIDATDTIAIDSAADISLTGTLDANSITLASADIAIGAGSTLGSARTTTLDFINNGAGGTFIGASGGEGDYQLSAAELASAHAASITIETPGAAPSSANASALTTAAANVVIGDVALLGSTGPSDGQSANLVGDSGTLAITTPGTIQLTGTLALSHLGAGNHVSLSAGQMIEGDLPAAGITLADASGGLAGTLSLQADRIVFATPAAQQALATATTQTERRDILAASDGVVNTDGYIRADTVNIAVGSALLNQNSGVANGTGDDRAGITAGLAISAIQTPDGDAVPVDLVLNARIESATGLLTGSDAVDPVLQAATVAFSEGSTINGCPIDGTTCSPIATILRDIPPVQDVLQEVTLPSGIGQSIGYSFESPQLIASTDLAPFQVAPLIDEPVTGAGNDSLWAGIGTGKDQPVGPPAKTGAH